MLADLEAAGNTIPVATNPAPEVETLEVLEPNWNAVQVFQLCNWQRSGDGNFDGIQAAEISHVARFADIPEDLDLLERVRIMERVGARELNEAIAEKMRNSAGRSGRGSSSTKARPPSIRRPRRR